MNIAIIPARGGSKRIPRKNIKEFHGKPMIAYSIEAALKSDCFDHVMVSTDDEEIAAIALQYGATVPFMRPAEISDDYATTLDVIAHALTWCQQNQMDVSKLLWEQTIYQRFESSGFWSLRWCNRRKSEKIIK